MNLCEQSFAADTKSQRRFDIFRSLTARYDFQYLQSRRTSQSAATVCIARHSFAGYIGFKKSFDKNKLRFL
jgi:hypothetical protein